MTYPAIWSLVSSCAAAEPKNWNWRWSEKEKKFRTFDIAIHCPLHAPHTNAIAFRIQYFDIVWLWSWEGWFQRQDLGDRVKAGRKNLQIPTNAVFRTNKSFSFATATWFFCPLSVTSVTYLALLKAHWEATNRKYTWPNVCHRVENCYCTENYIVCPSFATEANNIICLQGVIRLWLVITMVTIKLPVIVMMMMTITVRIMLKMVGLYLMIMIKIMMMTVQTLLSN